LAAASEAGAAGPKPTVSFRPVWVAFLLALFGWFKTVNAGKFCLVILVSKGWLTAEQEILPCDTLGVARARTDIRCQRSPLP